MSKPEIYDLDAWRKAAEYPPAELQAHTCGLPFGIPVLSRSDRPQMPNAVYWLRQLAAFGDCARLRGRAVDLLLFGHITIYPDCYNDNEVVSDLKAFCACRCDVNFNEDWGCFDIEINDGEPMYHIRDMYDFC